MKSNNTNNQHQFRHHFLEENENSDDDIEYLERMVGKKCGKSSKVSCTKAPEVKIAFDSDSGSDIDCAIASIPSKNSECIVSSVQPKPKPIICSKSVVKAQKAEKVSSGSDVHMIEIKAIELLNQIDSTKKKLSTSDSLANTINPPTSIQQRSKSTQSYTIPKILTVEERAFQTSRAISLSSGNQCKVVPVAKVPLTLSIRLNGTYLMKCSIEANSTFDKVYNRLNNRIAYDCITRNRLSFI